MVVALHDKDSHDVRIFAVTLQHPETRIEVSISSCRVPPYVYLLEAIPDFPISGFSASDSLILLPANRIVADCLTRDSTQRVGFEAGMLLFLLGGTGAIHFSSPY